MAAWLQMGPQDFDRSATTAPPTPLFSRDEAAGILGEPLFDTAGNAATGDRPAELTVARRDQLTAERRELIRRLYEIETLLST